MCGIAGYLNFDGYAACEDTLRSMASAMVHRGPDGEGVHVSGPFGLAHRRLSIIDLSAGSQPMCNEDASVWTVFNGEIYNFKELRAELESKGHVFRTHSDTEVIVHLYEECGYVFPERLNGMFAIAVADLKMRRLFLARDRLGKKPLLYFRTDKELVFGSEMGALKAHPSMPSELDMQAIWDYLSLQYIPAPRTAFKGVMKLPPASILEISLDAGVKGLRYYWRPDYAMKSEASYGSTKEELRSLVEDSVRRRLVSDVPLGVFLSGGLDSAIIAGVMCNVSDSPVKSFTIGFEDGLYDERRSAEETAAHLSRICRQTLQSSVKLVRPDDFAAVETLIRNFGEPYSDASMLPTCLLSRFTREFVTVALSGDGADEIFGGYERYLAMKWLGFADLLPLSARESIAAAARIVFPPMPEERSFSGRLHRFLRAAISSPSVRYMNVISRVGEGLKRSVCGDAFEALDMEESVRCIAGAISTARSEDDVEKLMETDLHSYLPGDILPKVDIASMSCSLEVRCPFLDYRIVELAAMMPRRFKQAGSTRKRILHDTFSDILPPGIGSRPKRGFGVPLAEWFRSGWLPTLKERLLEGSAVKRGLLRPEAMSALVDEHSARLADHSYALFSLLALELFAEGLD